MAILFTPQLQSEYQRLFDTCIITPDKYSEIDSYISKMVQAQQRYESVSIGTKAYLRCCTSWKDLMVMAITASVSFRLTCGANSNHYTKGKFVKDGVYSPTTVSKQCGAAVLLRRMFEKQIITSEIAAVDRKTLIQNLGANVLYSPNRYVAKAEELQKLLNLNGVHIRVGGKAGMNTSDAYFSVENKFLTGDPRIQ